MTGPKYAEPGLQPRSSSSSTATSRNTLSSISLSLAYTCAKLVVQACAFFLVSTSIHGLVHSLDAVYDAVGRRSRTQFETTAWAKLALGVSLLVGWHLLLVKLSVRSSRPYGETGAVQEEGPREPAKKGARPAWGRLLGRVVLPGLVVVMGAAFAVQLAARLFPSAAGRGGEGEGEGAK